MALTLPKFQQDGTGAVNRDVGDKLKEFVSVKDFGAVGDGVTDDTAAIQAALNNTATRQVLIPPGKYRITSTLTLNQNAVLLGAGNNDELNNAGLNNISVIQVDGDFNGVQVNPSAPSYYGSITVRNLRIQKVGGSTKTNIGFYAQFFVPNIVLEQVYTIGFDRGFDFYSGIAQINSCTARANNTGFRLRSTSTTMQNCYAILNTTGYLFAGNVFTSLISLAADANTTAYRFDTGATGPFTSDFLKTYNVVEMLNCGAESGGSYMYVDGNWDIEVNGPTTYNMSATPSFAHIESARRVTFRQMSYIAATNWLYVNEAKCTKDVVVIDGDMPPQSQVSPPTPAYNRVPVSIAAAKIGVGTFLLAKTRVPNITNSPKSNSAGAGAGQMSYLYRGLFAAQAQVTNRIRFRVKVLGNGFASSAQIKFSQFAYLNGGGDAGGDVYLAAGNSGGIATRTRSTSTDITVTQSSASSPDGYTYRYFFVESNASYVYLWDVTAACNFELYQADMFSVYENWTVTNADATTTGSITAGTTTLTVASGIGITDGMQILVNGAGAAGAVLITTVVSGGGTTTLTLAASASTTVASAAVSAYTL